MVDKFQAGTADKAIPYCGLGSLFFYMEEYEMVNNVIIGIKMFFTCEVAERDLFG